ncbi:MAG: hypothetical protein WCW56_01150 [Candidatus Paceibacterota bacterium]|jgi:hypothetical protein
MSNSKTKIFWLLASIDVLLFVGWIVLSFLTWQKVSVETAIADLNDGEFKIELAELKRFLTSSQGKIDTIGLAVVDSENVNSLVDQILNLAQGAGVEAAIDRATASKDSLDLIISAKGNFRNSVQFLRLMEKLPYRLTISKESMVNLAGTGSDLLKAKTERVSSLWRSEINIKILSYHQ